MTQAAYIGLMSGTSMDAIDGALVCFPPDRPPELLATHSVAYTPALKDELRILMSGGTLRHCAALDLALGHAFADCALTLLQACPAGYHVAAIGSHGQTVLHVPTGPDQTSLQLADPSVIVAATGVPVVADFRRLDQRYGGQGAPLAAAFHAHVLGRAFNDSVVVNLGGIANITWIPGAEPLACIGFDTGPANTLMDAWTSRHCQQAFDAAGAWAASGRLVPALLETLLSDPYFALPPPKSTGPEYFNLGWLESRGGPLGQTLAAVDVQRTLLELTVRSVADAIASHAASAETVWLCGGGVRNAFLVEGLRRTLHPRRVAPTDEAGVPAAWMEAMAFAWLAKERMAGRPNNLPAVTGADRPLSLGAVYLPG